MERLLLIHLQTGFGRNWLMILGTRSRPMQVKMMISVDFCCPLKSSGLFMKSFAPFSSTLHALVIRNITRRNTRDRQA